MTTFFVCLILFYQMRPFSGRLIIFRPFAHLPHFAHVVVVVAVAGFENKKNAEDTYYI